MPEIGVSVTQKAASAAGMPRIVCGNSDYVIAFSFDAEWDAYTAKTARFAYYKGGLFRYEDVLFEGDSVSVPVLHDVDEVAVGVYAGSLHTTTPARIPCARSITDGDAVHDPPAPDVYNQLMEYLAELQNGAASGAAIIRSAGAEPADAGETTTDEEET